jgi:phage-related protein
MRKKNVKATKCGRDTNVARGLAEKECEGNKKMHGIVFYKDINGNAPIKDYIKQLKAKTDKNSRIKLNKIQDYIKALRIHGTQLGEPYIKHLADEIWELRPIKDRVLFAKWLKGGFILLHHFVKKTKKTPRREIDQAKRNFEDFMERRNKDEQKQK